MDISIIIPTYNEEKYLETTLDYIVHFMPPAYNYEIIIIDNNSTDRTIDIAEKFDTIILKKQSGTIGTLRNIGVKHSKGKILLFLDADVSLTEQWKDNFPKTFNNLIKNTNLVTGSTYGVSQTDNLIEKYWFAPLLEKPLGHINSGHLIVTRKLFDAINGFDEALITGEDYDFSRRCKAYGASIFDDSSLHVHHEGYPKTIKAFFRREAWHGMGDFQSLKHFISSYVAIFAVTIFFSSLFFIFNLLVFHDLQAGIFSLLVVILICATVTLKKYNIKSLNVLLINTALYYIYFTARAYSLWKVLFKKKTGRSRII